MGSRNNIASKTYHPDTTVDLVLEQRFVTLDSTLHPIASGLQAWYDASKTNTITESGGSVSQWNDLSGSGFHLTQATGTNQPTTGTRTLFGRNVIDFDGSNDFMTSNCPRDDRTMSAFVVAMSDTTAAIAVMISGTVSTGGNELRAEAGGNLTLTKEGVSNLLASTNCSITAGTPFVAAEILDDVMVEIRRGTTNQITSVATTFTAGRVLRVGSRPTGANWWNGVIGEIIQYNRTLSHAETDAMMNYLADKWGI